MALVCPVFFMGQIDGLYWYVGERCADHTYPYISSSSPLTITQCPGNAEFCQDDGTGLAASLTPEMVFFRTTADDGAIDYHDPAARFPETPGIVDQLDQNDCTFKDDQGVDRTCRLFMVRVRYKATVLYLRVGFELKPGAIPPPPMALQNVQKLGAKAYRGDFGLVQFFVLLRR